MRRVLLVTTQSAQRIVSEVLSSLTKDYTIEVLVSNAVVAQFTSCEELAAELKEKLLKCGYDAVIVPGLVRGSTEVIEEAIGCRVYKGSKYAGDIPTVLELLESGLELSREIPADELYEDLFTSNLLKAYEAEVNSKKPLFSLGGLGVYLDPPPIRLLLEVLASDREVFEKKVLRAASAGFDGVVIGSGSKSDGARLGKFVARAREMLGSGIVGVDVLKVSDLSSDIVEQVDLVLNVANFDVDKIATRLGQEKGVVVIPSTLESLEKAIDSIKVTVSMLREVGVEKILVDPLVSPPGLGLADSLGRFRASRKSLGHPHVFSTANVYEMVDADSHGVIALLVTLALELGASIILATEESNKAYGAIEEHSIARYMAYVSHLKKSPPKDIPGGTNLLVVKGKNLAGPSPPEAEGFSRTVSMLEHRQDPNYYVRIYADHSEGVLVVDVLKVGSGKMLARFVGTHPTSLARAVVREFELMPEHAAYLGYELAKAELALKFRKGYTQDYSVIDSPRDRVELSRNPLVSSYRKA